MSETYQSDAFLVDCFTYIAGAGKEPQHCVHQMKEYSIPFTTVQYIQNICQMDIFARHLYTYMHHIGLSNVDLNESEVIYNLGLRNFYLKIFFFSR